MINVVTFGCYGCWFVRFLAFCFVDGLSVVFAYLILWWVSLLPACLCFVATGCFVCGGGAFAVCAALRVSVGWVRFWVGGLIVVCFCAMGVLFLGWLWVVWLRWWFCD